MSAPASISRASWGSPPWLPVAAPAIASAAPPSPCSRCVRTRRSDVHHPYRHCLAVELRRHRQRPARLVHPNRQTAGARQRDKADHRADDLGYRLRDAAAAISGSSGVSGNGHRQGARTGRPETVFAGGGIHLRRADPARLPVVPLSRDLVSRLMQGPGVVCCSAAYSPGCRLKFTGSATGSERISKKWHPHPHSS